MSFHDRYVRTVNVLLCDKYPQYMCYLTLSEPDSKKVHKAGKIALAVTKGVIPAGGAVIWQ